MLEKKTISQPCVNDLEVNEKAPLMRKEKMVSGSSNWTNKLIRQHSNSFEKSDIVKTVVIPEEVIEAIIDDRPFANNFQLDGIPKALHVTGLENLFQRNQKASGRSL